MRPIRASRTSVLEGGSVYNRVPIPFLLLWEREKAKALSMAAFIKDGNIRLDSSLHRNDGKTTFELKKSNRDTTAP